jgi:hypothetical protein
MDGSESPVLLEEIRRLERLYDDLLELVVDQAFRSAVFQTLMTDKFREIAALRETNHRLREELRRYTASKVG